MCLICNEVENRYKLTVECKAYVFLKQNIPEGVKLFANHLDYRGYILYHLINGLRFINRPYIIRGPLLQTFLESICTVANNFTRFSDENDSSDEESKTFFSITKSQFYDRMTFCDKVPCQGVYRYDDRQGLSDEFISLIIQYTTRQATIATVRQSLMQRFVPSCL